MQPVEIENLYQRLGTSPEARSLEIKDCYQNRMREYHPNNNPELDYETMITNIEIALLILNPARYFFSQFLPNNPLLLSF